MPRNAIHNFTIEILIYTLEIIDKKNQGKAYIVSNVVDGIAIPEKFDVTISYNPYHSSTFYDSAGGGELINIQVLDVNGNIIPNEFLLNHYVQVVKYNTVTKRNDDIFLTLYQYICSNHKKNATK